MMEKELNLMNLKSLYKQQSFTKLETKIPIIQGNRLQMDMFSDGGGDQILNLVPRKTKHMVRRAPAVKIEKSINIF